MRRWCPAPATALLVVLLGMMGSGLWWLDSIHSGIKAVLHEYRKPQEIQMNTYTTTWTDATGLSHTVTTTRDPSSETPAQHAERHKAAVDALKSEYPPAT